MRLGIGSYTYVWSVGVSGYAQPERPLTAFTLLDKAVALGVRVVQIADNLPLHKLADDELDCLLARADELGLELEVGTRGIAEEHLLHYTRLAGRLRSRILRVVIDTATDHPSAADVVARLTPLLPAFETAGVTLAIENHDRFSAVSLRDILDALGSPYVGICLDTANSLGCLENVEHVVETVGARVVNLHIKDVCAVRAGPGRGFIIEGRPAGQGQIDLPGLLQRLGALGVDPNAIVELWPPPEPTLAASIAKEEVWARESVAYARTLIPG